MHRTGWLLILAVAVGLFGGYWFTTGLATARTDVPYDVQRFELLAGQYTVEALDDAPLRTEPGVFRIDTITGQTWRYVEQRYDGRRERTWVVVPDDYLN